MEKIKNINLQLFADETIESETNENENENEKNINQESDTKNESDTNKESVAKDDSKNENVSRETLNKNFESINQNLKNINTNIRKLNKIDEPEEDNSINLSSVDNKKILVDKNNKKLTDYELFKRTLKIIKTDKENGKKIPVTPKFIEYMEKYVENHEKNIMTDEQFKRENIFEEIPLSEVNI